MLCFNGRTTGCPTIGRAVVRGVKQSKGRAEVAGLRAGVASNGRIQGRPGRGGCGRAGRSAAQDAGAT
ncbi:hypothetical protein MILUP08_45063 [Micromonospora lupini str. Lupac 08]|uniref:Uncharacterized protein n=1 Tax=Micromonospora lupini str. Lupac 08 TaxID=1150864 RepID=I0L8N6_9ACTN|nr:hypothetical protein MILUP08_45063 [Micromonospora lupini str. Lupac 08]